MNERIKELAEQAWLENDYNLLDCGYTDLVIFTKLIVQECATLVEVEYSKSEVSGNEVARVLKQHFGVEE